MKRYTEKEIREAMRKVRDMGIKQYKEPENEQMKNHGYGVEDAVVMLEILLNM